MIGVSAHSPALSISLAFREFEKSPALGDSPRAIASNLAVERLPHLSRRAVKHRVPLSYNVPHRLVAVQGQLKWHRVRLIKARGLLPTGESF
jgi:hypothetical protein